MTKKNITDDRNVILFVGGLLDGTLDYLKAYNKKSKQSFEPLIIADQNKVKALKELRTKYEKDNVSILACNLRSKRKIKQTLAPYINKIVAVTVHTENRIPDFKKVIPHLPYLNAPTVASLDWASDKILMRRMIDAHDSSLAPKFLIAEEASLDVIERVGKRIGYPVVVKPAGLAGSKLVSMCYHEDELQHVLKKTFRKLHKAYREHYGRGEPQIIVEKVMEGIMYSVDGYVDAKGKVTLLHPVHVKTGKEIGFDDFFGYRQMTPTQLNKKSIEGAFHATKETVKALCLRSTTIHCELFKTEDGWKIIEIGPRMGGYRDTLYRLSYGIDHIMNDVLNKIGLPLIIPKKRLGYATYMKFYAKEEGIITNITGTPAVKRLSSFVEMIVEKKIGDEAPYAKNGGGPVVKLVLSNPERSGLLADIRRVEQNLNIETKPSHVFRKQLEDTADAILQPIEDVELLSKKAAKKLREILEDTFDPNNPKKPKA